MQTITVASINQGKVDTDQFIRRARSIKLRRELKAGENRFEELDVPIVAKLNSQAARLRGLATGIIRRKRPAIVVATSLIKDYLQRTETEQEVEDFTRVWVGHEKYLLLCFMAGFPGGTYPGFRLLAARSLSQDKLEEDQQLVSPVVYDLPAVQKSFPRNIWDQNFKRKDPISRGRIQGSAMEIDPLYKEFKNNIATFIGVEIPTTGKQERVKVFSDGRLQFMGLQPGPIEEPATRDTALETIIQVLNKLSSCLRK